MATTTLDELKQIQNENWERSQKLKRETESLLGDVQSNPPAIPWAWLLAGAGIGAAVVALTINFTGTLT